MQDETKGPLYRVLFCFFFALYLLALLVLLTAFVAAAWALLLGVGWLLLFTPISLAIPFVLISYFATRFNP